MLRRDAEIPTIHSFPASYSYLCTLQSGGSIFVFYISPPLYYVAVSRTGESAESIGKQLEMLHKTIIFTLTATQLQRIFDRHSNFDLRSLLGGTDVLLDSICKYLRDPFLFLNAIPPVKLAGKHRKLISKSWTVSIPPKPFLYGILIANKRVISTLQFKKTSTLSPQGNSFITTYLIARKNELRIHFRFHMNAFRYGAGY